MKIQCRQITDEDEEEITHVMKKGRAQETVQRAVGINIEIVKMRMNRILSLACYNLLDRTYSMKGT